MGWLLLGLAGLFEIGWAVGLKHAKGFTHAGATFATLACMALSLGLLGLALRALPLGTAYAAWTGIGVVGTVALGILLDGEPAGALRLGCIVLILLGILGLKVLT
ncbi:MAG: multidrug efflux SMR transporter [Alphaproteobacteria bacterium]